eukprot:m.1485454 g.1485454  ORF g.1485454 m.1485454 type:complete len:133 (+) comp25182_c0_seq6:4170-4568(+)
MRAPGSTWNGGLRPTADGFLFCFLKHRSCFLRTWQCSHHSDADALNNIRHGRPCGAIEDTVGVYRSTRKYSIDLTLANPHSAAQTPPVAVARCGRGSLAVVQQRRRRSGGGGQTLDGHAGNTLWTHPRNMGQ